MVPAQFQLGLELTNIVNPINQAVSALGSLAVIDAIKRSGSDFVTETKLANLIGRHRIDPIIKFHFREMVAKSDQSMISRYLDIILEAGSGPTVQEALKNPALFSMVIQLSALAFAHENEALANSIVEAIENIVRESGGNMGIVPDYVSLLGTVRACQQQTAAFRWALLYEAAEEKIRKALDIPDIRSRMKRNLGYHITDEFGESDQSRALPVPVLQGLFMWLRSLQSFPEHRLLHLRCSTGISTIVVWCHHILGLSLVINTRGAEIQFGDAPYNLIVEDSPGQKADVSLMDPLSPQEPLFTLQNDEPSSGISYDHRAEAYGYGARFFQFQKFPEREWETLARWVISYSIEACEALGTSEILSDTETNPPNKAHDFGLRYPSRLRLLNAGRFLFALDEGVAIQGSEAAEFLGSNQKSVVVILVVIMITFARVSEDDLEKCREMPLALNVSTLSGKRLKAFDPKDSDHFLDLLQSFEVLSLLLLGHHLYHDYGKSPVLLSAWGWSVFLDSIDAVDPLDVSIDTLRVMRGVPSRRGFRRTRIIDGPRRAVRPTTLPVFDYKGFGVYPAEEVITAKKGAILVGHHNDAFQVTQQFTCHNEGTPKYRFGFREMAHWSIKCRRLPPCDCAKPNDNDLSEVRPHVIDKLLREEDGVVRRIGPSKNGIHSSYPFFASKDGGRLFVYVSDNPAARWLQLETMYSHYGLEDENYVGLGGQDTCVHCAIRNSELLPPNGIFLL